MYPTIRELMHTIKEMGIKTKTIKSGFMYFIPGVDRPGIVHTNHKTNINERDYKCHINRIKKLRNK